jgi:hypothetical protein
MSKALMQPCITLKRQQPGNRNPARKRQRGQRQRLDHRQGLGPHQHLPAVEPVHPYAGKGRQKKGGNLSCKADRAQQQRRAGQPVDQPAGGHARHPRADHRDALPAKEKPEVAMAQRPPRMRDAGGHAQLHLAGSLDHVHARNWIRITQKLLPHSQFIVTGFSGRGTPRLAIAHSPVVVALCSATLTRTVG